MREPIRNIPTVLIILGATGDLMSRKIAPALFNLFDKNNLPQKFDIIGFARRPLTDNDFRASVKKMIGNHAHGKQKQLNLFLKSISYHEGTFQDKKSYTELSKKLNDIDDSWGVCSNKLFYLAVPPEFYGTITNHLSSSGLTDLCSPEEGWTRILIEKPFGEDLKTNRGIEKQLSKLFREIQIYRIDHYLAKEMLQNILNFRFSNTLFESIWNKHSIEKIDIRLLESIGVEKRAAFYDSLGTLRDVGQNHLLQMLALITMEHPGKLNAEAIRFKRAELLRTLRPLSKKEIETQTFRAQYNGYRKIDGVAPHSMTETYFKMHGAFLDSPLWQDVPITLESGKRIGDQIKEIVITFKHPTPCLCPPGTQHYKNKIAFTIEPKEGIDIQFWSKKPGLDFEIEKRNFQFLLREEQKKIQYVEEYEKLLLDCITGDQTLFVSTDEVRAMWAFTDPIVKAWGNGAVPMHYYKPNTNNVLEASRVLEKHEVQIRPSIKPPIVGERVIGMVGLGKMGGNITHQLKRKGWDVIGNDKNPEVIEKFQRQGVKTASTLTELIKTLPKPRIVWLMIPAGKPTDDTITELSKLLKRGDIVIDGSNSFYKNTIKRYKKLSAHGIHMLDVGISGGPEGALKGASLMIGGEKKLFRKLDPLFLDVAYEEGYQFFEGAGAGHFIKMVHNGIEYGMMQAIAEGFTILKTASYNLDLTKIADVYNHGAVIESRLIGWLKEAFDLYGEDLDEISGMVGHNNTGEWAAKTAKELGVKAKIIEESFKFRIMSKKNPDYTGRMLNALRERFGGHPVKKKQI